MQHFLKKSMISWGLIFFGAVVVRGDSPTLSAEVSSERIFIGDAVTLAVTLDGASANGVMPELAHTENCTVSGPQPRSQSSRNIMIINGKRTEEVIERTSWIYSVSPQKSGVLSIGEAQAKVNGRMLKASIPDITVVGPEPQSYVKVGLSASRNAVLLDEPFEVNLAITVRKLEGEQSSANPLPDANHSPALLEIPFFADGSVKGSKLDVSLDAFLNGLMQGKNDAGTFQINNYTVNSSAGMFALFGDRQAALFYLDRTDGDLDGKPAWIYRLKIPFRATEEGSCRFGAIRFKGNVYSKTASGTLNTVSVFAVSEPLEVKVTPPPEDGRPKSFIGSLGTRLEALVALDAQSCSEGDPLALTLEIKGDLTLSNMREPKLFDNLDMAARFRQYGDIRRDKTDAGMRYTYKVRPIVSGTIEVPSFELSFYNTVTRRYETIHTAPVPLRVDPAAQLDPNAILGVSTNTASASLSFRDDLVPSAITVTPRGISTPIRANRGRVVTVALVPPLIYAVVVLLTSVWRKRRSWGKAVKRRSATGRSVHGIQHAKTPQAVMDAVGVFLHDKMDVSGSGFTPGDVREILLGHGVDAATASEITKLLQEVFDSGFSPDADPVKLVKARRGRLAELFSGLRVGLVMMAFLGTSLAAAGADRNSAMFTWRQANASAASARTPSDFQKAAKVYRTLIDNGTVNGEVLYNYGTMLLFAGHPQVAVEAFRRAEAIDGASPELENNMRVAYRNLRKSAASPSAKTWQSQDPDDDLPWYRVPLFWHYGVPLQVRVNALGLLWCVLWGGLLIRKCGLRRLGLLVFLLGLAGTALLGTSTLASRRVLSEPLPDIPEIVAVGEGTVSK